MIFPDGMENDSRMFKFFYRQCSMFLIEMTGSFEVLKERCMNGLVSHRKFWLMVDDEVMLLDGKAR